MSSQVKEVNGTAADTPLRVATRTKDQVKAIAGSLAVTHADVVELAVRKMIKVDGPKLTRLHEKLMHEPEDDAEIEALRHDLLRT
jgi:hypothetical protein